MAQRHIHHVLSPIYVRIFAFDLSLTIYCGTVFFHLCTVCVTLSLWKMCTRCIYTNIKGVYFTLTLCGLFLWVCSPMLWMQNYGFCLCSVPYNACKCVYIRFCFIHFADFDIINFVPLEKNNIIKRTSKQICFYGKCSRRFLLGRELPYSLYTYVCRQLRFFFAFAYGDVLVYTLYSVHSLVFVLPLVH